MHVRTATETWTGTDPRADDAATRSFLGRAPRLRGTPLPAQLGPYRVLALLGEGGMARVYLAEHTVMGRRVAIKRLLPALARHPEAHALFLREARIAGSVRHPNLVDVYDFGLALDGSPYYVMELATGETLARRLARGPLLLSQCLDTGVVLADAVAAVHAAGYVHRDIKAENVVLARHERRLVPKLIDFGIAHRLDPTVADPGAPAPGVCGTPRTMAPEQVALDPIDERTDVYALGATLFELLAGQAFARGRLDASDVDAVPSRRGADVPPELDELGVIEALGGGDLGPPLGRAGPAGGVAIVGHAREHRDVGADGRMGCGARRCEPSRALRDASS